MKSRFGRGLVAALAVAALVIAIGAPAQAQPIFKVQEGSIPGSLPFLVTGNTMDFQYKAQINQQGPFPLNNSPFTEVGSFSIGSIKLNGTAQPAQLNSAFFGYGIVGDFNASGTASQQGAGILATFNTFNAQFFADPNQNTTTNFTGLGGVTGDDILLATGALVAGEAHVFPGLANGDFAAILLVTLTAAGQAYFVDPSPFYVALDFSGNTSVITGASLTQPFVAESTGGGILFFAQVPAPGSLMLLGLGLTGLAAFGRRHFARS